MRFPTMDSLVEAKLLLPHEADRLEKVDFRWNDDQTLPHNLNLCGHHHMKIQPRTPHEATWAPVLWALNLLCRARQEGKITLEPPVRTILSWKSMWNLVQVWANMVTAFEYVEDCNRKVLNYGWIEFPLAYTQVWGLYYVLKKTQAIWCISISYHMQVATLSVYAYFTAALFGRQFLEPRGEHKLVFETPLR